MQLVQLTNKIKPITIAAGLLSASSCLAYSEVDSFSGILTEFATENSSQYLRYVDTSDRQLYNIDVFRFQTHLINWKKKTMFLSSTKAIIEDLDFRAIVAMEYTAVPFIVEEIESNPSALVWALNLIFNRKITNNPNATISEACKLWVKELKK